MVFKKIKKQISFQKLKKELYFEDGSLRDICIKSVNLNDRHKLIKFINNNNYQFTINDKKFSANESIDIINSFFNDIEIAPENTESICIRVILWKITLNCHPCIFNNPSDFMDIAPWEFQSLEHHETLINFLNKLKPFLNKDLWISEENSNELILLKI